MRNLLQAYSRLTKSGIVIFVLLSASFGYFLSFNENSIFSTNKLLLFLLGLYFVSSGSFILNQAQERKLDCKMNRTKKRPIASGNLSPFQGYILAFGFLIFGSSLLLILKPLSAFLALLTVFLYNGFYTLLWKKHFRYAAVPGALPGALPPVIGYSLGENSFLTTECLYLFLLMFLWQMPHFWSLALKYKEDYQKAGIPTLPVVFGPKKTLQEISFYILAYSGLALISPMFLRAGIMYAILLLPLVLKILYEFHRYLNNHKQWLRFFLWINASVIVYLSVPVFDKWLMIWLTGHL